MWIVNSLRWSIFKLPCETKFTIDYSLLWSGKQDSNLRPPASKTGKQPPLSFQFCRFTSIFFSERQSDPEVSVNLCCLCENRTRSAWATVRQVSHYLNRPPLWSRQDCSWISYFIFMVFTNTSYFKPVTLGLENPYSIQLSYETVAL